jgi:transposase-like protein
VSDGKDVNVGRFTDDYKPQAVDLVASSGRSIGSVAKELGLRDSVLRRWVELRGSQLRLWFASMTYVLTCALRRIGLDKTVFADATCGIIRLKSSRTAR